MMMVQLDTPSLFGFKLHETIYSAFACSTAKSYWSATILYSNPRTLLIPFDIPCSSSTPAKEAMLMLCP